MDSSEDNEVFDEVVGLSEEPRTYPGADLKHIAAVLADPNPNSGQLQGRRMHKQAKRRRPWCPPSMANEDGEAGSSDLPVSRKAARKSEAGSRLPRIPEQSPFDPKGKGKQQMPSPVATPRQDQHHSSTPSKDTEGHAWQRGGPQRQRKHGSSEAGAGMISPSLGQLHLDSDEETKGPSQGRNAPSTRTFAGASSSAGPSSAHHGGRTSFSRKPKVRRHPKQPAMHPFYDRPGEHETAEALFCEACGCWVPLHPDDDKRIWKPPGNREEVWQQHLRGDRHACEVAARLAEDAKLDSTHHYRSKVLPAMKHAAEELRMLGVVSGDGVAPTVRQATRTANEILKANDDTTRRITKLHKDALTELLHHAGSNNTYQRLAMRLAIERLACAWPAVADMAPRPEGTLVAVNATPATIACLAAQLPLKPATTLIISLAPVSAYDLAPVTAALCLLVRALVTDNSVRRLQLNLAGSSPDTAYAAVPQICRVLSELNRTVELNTSLRRLFLHVHDKESYVEDWATIKATAVNAAPRQRMAVAMALHPRVGHTCLLKWLPLHVIRDVLDLAVPAVPCKFVLSDRDGVAKPI